MPRVPPEAAGQRLDVFLAEHAGSRSAAQRLLEDGRVTVDGQPRPKRHRVTPGEQVDIAKTPPVAAESMGQAPRFTVVYEDDDLLVVDKPAGLVVHPGSGVHDTTLTEVLGDRVAGGSDPVRPGVVHRLDRDTSGLLVLARTEAAHAGLQPRAMQREYLALVEGRPPARTGTIDAPLGRDRRRRTRRSSDTDDPRPAVTHFAFDTTYVGATLLRVRLETGRTHQIRAHLLAIGHPVLGDPEYGVAHPGLARQFLHATGLALVHPTTGQPLEFESPLPGDLAAALLDFKPQ